MKIKVLYLLLGTVVGLILMFSIQSYFRSSYDIVIYYDNFLSRVDLADAYYNEKNVKDFEKSLLCDVVYSAQDIDSYFELNGYSSESIDLKSISQEYNKIYKNFYLSLGYEDQDGFEVMCNKFLK